MQPSSFRQNVETWDDDSYFTCILTVISIQGGAACFLWCATVFPQTRWFRVHIAASGFRLLARTTVPLWDVHVHFDCASLHKVVVLFCSLPKVYFYLHVVPVFFPLMCMFHGRRNLDLDGVLKGSKLYLFVKLLPCLFWNDLAWQAQCFRCLRLIFLAGAELCRYQ